jgi:exodeoxyribonuclease VIII
LDKIARSAAHYRYAEKETSPALALGTAVHCAVLEPAIFAEDYVCAPSVDKRTKAGKEELAEFESKYALCTVLSADDYLLCERIRDAVRKHVLAAKYLASGQAEVSLVWRDEETGCTCRARIDWLTHDDDGRPVILDLKTTQDAGATSFAKSCATFRYHVQAAWFSDGYQQFHPERPRFIFCAVEKKAPFGVALYELDDAAVAHGRKLARRDLTRYATARALDIWEGYPLDVQTLFLPRWAVCDELEGWA